MGNATYVLIVIIKWGKQLKVFFSFSVAFLIISS